MGSQGQTKTLQPIPPIMSRGLPLTRSTAMSDDPISLPSIRAWKLPPSLESNIGVKRRRSISVSWSSSNPWTVTPTSPSPLLPSMTLWMAAGGSHSINSSKKNNSNSNSSTQFQAQWLYFKNSRWIPLDRQNHHKLERTLELGGIFTDIQDSHFPAVQKIRVFPRADYLSYLGIRYRISRILLPPV